MCANAFNSAISLMRLPLEIRRQIYRELIPTDENHNYVAELPSKYLSYRDSLSDLCDAIPQLAKEIRDEYQFSCTRMVFEIDKCPLKPKTSMNFPNLEIMDIIFKRYPIDVEEDCGCCRTFTKPRDREPNLAVMFRNAKLFTGWVKKCGIIPKRYLEITFEGYEDADKCWCEAHWDDGDKEYAYSLRTRMASPNCEVTVMESMLQALKDFPIVPGALINDFNWTVLTCADGLDLCGVDDRFDSSYALSLDLAWSSWLKGNRDISWRRQMDFRVWQRQNK